MLVPRGYRIRHQIIGHLYGRTFGTDGDEYKAAISIGELARLTGLPRQEVHGWAEVLWADQYLNLLPNMSEDASTEALLVVLNHFGAAAFVSKDFLRQGREERAKVFALMFGYIAVPIGLIATSLAIWRAFDPSDHEQRIRSLEQGMQQEQRSVLPTTQGQPDLTPSTTEQGGGSVILCGLCDSVAPPK